MSGVQSARREIVEALADILFPANTIQAGLAALGIVGVFDIRAVPENQPFDYLTIGDATELPMNTMGRRGYLTTTTVHFWSRALGTQTADLVIAQLNVLIDQRDLTLATQSHVYTMYDQSMTIPDPDGLTMHTTVRYKIFTQE
jgi:Protein of unknown function (DUF3168)